MITGNEPAMPLSLLDFEGEIHSNEDISYECKGLTIRQHFAALAMQGMLSNQGFVDSWNCQAVICNEAVNYADALINELNKEI